MKKLLQTPIGIMAALVMVATMLIMPQASSARMILSDGSHSGGPGGGEGDPLDSNDYDGGDGGAVHERRIVPRGSDLVIYETNSSTLVLMLRLDVLDGVPIFSIYAVDAANLGAEANHVR